MLKKLCLLLIVSLLSTGSFAPSTQAQESGTIQALATVVSTLRVLGTRDLLFETVTPGVIKTVDKATVGRAGEWEITGIAGAEVTVDLTLPSQMVTADSSSTMPISFSSTDVSYEDGTGGGQTNPAGVLNPSIQGTLDIGVGAILMMWIGGTVSPSINQTSGDYAADIILTVAYTGN